MILCVLSGVLLEVTVEVRPTGSHEHDWDRARNLYTTAVQTLVTGIMIHMSYLLI